MMAGLRWGAVVVTGLAAAIGLTPFAPGLSTLGAVADALNGALRHVAAGLGPGGAVGARMAASAILFLLLAVPISGRLRLGGPRAAAASVAILAGLFIAFGLCVGVGGEMIRLMSVDPAAPSLRETSPLIALGFDALYLEAATDAIGSLLQFTERQWPSFAAQSARVSADLSEPLSVLLYTSLVCLVALLPVFLARTAAALVFERVLRGGAARLAAAALFCVVVLGAFAGVELLINLK